MQKLWFVRAVEHLADAAEALPASGRANWGPRCGVIESFIAGTDCDIRARPDGLLWCGNPETQLTWMDARPYNRAITPRHGMPVEVTLWIHAAGWRRHGAGGAGRKAEVGGAEDPGGTGSCGGVLVRAAGTCTTWSATISATPSCGRTRRSRWRLPDCPLPVERQKQALEVIRGC